MGSPSLLGYRQRLLADIQKYGITMPTDYEKLTGWIEAYDLATHYEELPQRPLFFWHGTEDEKISFELTDDFVKQHAGPEITIVAEKEKHLVQLPTMDLVTDFFRTNL